MHFKHCLFVHPVFMSGNICHFISIVTEKFLDRSMTFKIYLCTEICITTIQTLEHSVIKANIRLHMSNLWEMFMLAPHFLRKWWIIFLYIFWYSPHTDGQLSRFICDRGHSARSPVASQQAPLRSVHVTWKWCMGLS